MERIKLPPRDGEGQQSPEMPLYQYSSLGAPTHIRVLIIGYRTFNSDIQFVLQEIKLGDGGINYTALSYA